LSKSISFFVAVALALLVPLATVYALPPALPAVFYGTVDAGQSLEGATVEAKVGDVSCGSTVVRNDPQLGWVYVLNVIADDPDTPALEGGKQGEAVTFDVRLADGRVLGVPKASAWYGGAAEERHLRAYRYAVLPLILVS